MVATCASGACQYACERGYTDCDGHTANGCEVDTGADNINCGACGNRCWGTSECCSGSCVDRNYDLNNCGTCGNVCATGANSFAACYAGTCALNCNWPWGNW